MKRKLLIVVSLSILLLTSCTMMTIPTANIAGYVQYYDGTNFTTSGIKVEVQLLDENLATVVSSMTVSVDSKGYYYFPNFPKITSSQFYAFSFEKDGHYAQFEAEHYPFFSNMTTIFNQTQAELSFESTNTTASMKVVGFVVKDSSGHLLFSRPFQWYYSDTNLYEDYVDLPYGTYTVCGYYFDDSSKEFKTSSTEVTLDSNNTSKTITVDFSSK